MIAAVLFWQDGSAVLAVDEDTPLSMTAPIFLAAEKQT